MKDESKRSLLNEASLRASFLIFKINFSNAIYINVN